MGSWLGNKNPVTIPAGEAKPLSEVLLRTLLFNLQNQISSFIIIITGEVVDVGKAARPVASEQALGSERLGFKGSSAAALVWVPLPSALPISSGKWC